MSENRKSGINAETTHSASYDVSYSIPVPSLPSVSNPGTVDEATHTSARAVENYVEQLLEGQALYTVADASQMSGLDREEVLHFWRSLGFPRIEDIDNERLFTDGDIEAMRAHAHVAQRGAADVSLSQETVHMLIRAQAQSMDRLVFWQQEALMEYAETALGMDATVAREWLLDRVSDYEDFLSMQMRYAWRRHMAALLRRTELETHSSAADMPSNYVSRCALGFIDLVSFTRHSSELENAELLSFIDVFDRTCRDIIIAKGGRVVKNIGDAFLYTANSIEVALDITITIVEKLRTIEGMLPVHAAVVWGEVITRFGDVFGTPVNLASRLAAAAMPNTVLTDEKTAAIIHRIGLKYTSIDLGHRDLRGLGLTRIMELRRIMDA